MCSTCRTDEQEACLVNAAVVDRWEAEVKRQKKVLPVPAEAACDYCNMRCSPCVLPRIEIIKNAMGPPAAQRATPTAMTPFQSATLAEFRALRQDDAAFEEVLEGIAAAFEGLANYVEREYRPATDGGDTNEEEESSDESENGNAMDMA